MLVRLRSGGATNVAAAYDQQLLVGSGGTAAATGTRGALFWGGIAGAPRTDKTIRITFLNLNRPESTVAEATVQASNATANQHLTNLVLRHRTEAAHDGVWFQTIEGTVTGRYEVRGL